MLWKINIRAVDRFDGFQRSDLLLFLQCLKPAGKRRTAASGELCFFLFSAFCQKKDGQERDSVSEKL